MPSRELPPWPARPVPLWPLPLLATLLPAIGTGVALVLYVPPTGGFCNPFFDDCVSISRMAKVGPANGVFRIFVLTGAVLQALVWLLLARVLAGRGATPRRVLPMAAFGVASAIALIVYTSFLGTDGDTYRWLRRRGTLCYFGGTYLALLLFARSAIRLHAAGALALPRAQARALVGLLAFVTVVALVHASASLFARRALEDRIENLTEWWGALALTLAFVVVTSLWRRWGVDFALDTRAPGGA